MTTLLTLPGAGWYGLIDWYQPMMPKMVRGEIAAGCDRVVPVNYANWLWPGGADNGKTELDKALRAELSSGSNVRVMGHSLGSEAIVLWLRDLAEDVDPTRVELFCLGTTYWMQDILATLNTPFNVNVITRQWDIWADYPNVSSSPHYTAAVMNVSYGDGWPHFIHSSYQNFSLTDPRRVNLSGNVIFALYDTNPIPLPDGNREQIESAYNRPRIEKGQP